MIVDVFKVRNSDDIEGALGRLQEARPDGIVVAPDLLLVSKRAEIAAALATSKLPAVYPFREYAAVGGLIIHGANLSNWSGNKKPGSRMGATVMPAELEEGPEDSSA